MEKRRELQTRRNSSAKKNQIWRKRLATATAESEEANAMCSILTTKIENLTEQVTILTRANDDLLKRINDNITASNIKECYRITLCDLLRNIEESPIFG